MVRRHAAGALAILVIVMLAIAYLSVPSQERIKIYPDDALFYGIIGQNTLDGHLFSFDGGVSRTNGFHWLGMAPALVFAAVHNAFWKAETFAEYLPRLYFFDILLLLLTVLVTLWAMPESLRRSIALPVLGILLFQAGILGLGMEVIFIPLLITLYTLVLIDRRKCSICYWLLPLLLPLARIDLAFLPTVLLVGHRLGRRWIGSVPPQPRRETLGCLVGTVAGILLVGTFNFAAAGSPFSSSMLAKGSGAWIVLPDLAGALRDQLPYLAFSALLIIALLTAKAARELWCILFLLASITLQLHVALMRSLGGNNLGSWYDVAWTSTLGIAWFGIVTSLKIRPAGQWFALLVSIIVAVVVLVPRQNLRLLAHRERPHHAAYYEQLQDIGRLISEATDVDAVLAIDDLPGRFTYYTDRDIVALDGLANSPQYVRDYLSTERVAEYLSEVTDYVILLLDPEDLQALGTARDGTPSGPATVDVGFRKSKNLEPSKVLIQEADVVLRIPRGDREVWLLRSPESL